MAEYSAHTVQVILKEFSDLFLALELTADESQ